MASCSCVDAYYDLHTDINKTCDEAVSELATEDVDKLRRIVAGLIKSVKEFQKQFIVERQSCSTASNGEIEGLTKYLSVAK